jgi:hypothetical protein
MEGKATERWKVGKQIKREGNVKVEDGRLWNRRKILRVQKTREENGSERKKTDNKGRGRKARKSREEREDE